SYYLETRLDEVAGSSTLNERPFYGRCSRAALNAQTEGTSHGPLCDRSRRKEIPDLEPGDRTRGHHTQFGVPRSRRRRLRRHGGRDLSDKTTSRKECSTSTTRVCAYDASLPATVLELVAHQAADHRIDVLAEIDAESDGPAIDARLDLAAEERLP